MQTDDKPNTPSAVALRAIIDKHYAHIANLMGGEVGEQTRGAWNAISGLKHEIDTALTAAPATPDPLDSYEKFDGVGPHSETIETRARIGERYLECYESALSDPRLASYTPMDCPSELLLDLLNGDALSEAGGTNLTPATDDRLRTYKLGDRVTKTKGSSWTGKVVGFYSTSLTPEGYAVESENEPGSVQIYPVAALSSVDTSLVGGGSEQPE